MIRNFTMGLLLVGSMAIGACNTQKKAKLSDTSVSLENVTWRLVELEGKAISEKVNGKTPSLTLKTEDARYSAVTGCNGIGGNYKTAKGQMLTLSAGMSTRMYCEGAMEIEEGLGKIFPLVNQYEIQENQLSLKDQAQKTLAVFTLMP